MSKKLDPIVSEFETEDAAQSYDRWFRRKVEAAMEDCRPLIPHEQVMAEVRQTIESAVRKAGK